MTTSPQIVTPTQQGFYLIPASLRPHGAFLLGHPGLHPSFDRTVPKHTQPLVVQLRHAYWHQPN